MKKKILVSVNPDMLDVIVHCDVTDAKTNEDFVNVLKKVFGKNEFEVDDDDGIERFRGDPLEDVVLHLCEDGDYTFDSDCMDALRIIDVGNVKSVLKKKQKKSKAKRI